RFNDPNEAYKKAIVDGWVRVTFRNSETNNRITTDNELALEGRDKDRIKNVLKTLFYDLVKNGTVQVYIDYPDADSSYSSDIIDPETSDGKAKLVNYISETVNIDLPPTLEGYNSFMIKDNGQTVGELGIIDRGVFGKNHYITIDKIFINKPFR